MNEEKERELDLTRRTRRIGGDKNFITVILPLGEKWMDHCKEGEEGWDVVDAVLQKGKLNKKNISWVDFEELIM